MECELGNISVHYEAFGEGRPIIMLHGWPTDHRHMAADFEPLFQDRTGWKRIYPDLPGMGKTPSREWITSQDQMLDIVLEFIDRIIPEQHFVVVGASYGGYLARGVIYRRAQAIDGALLLVPGILADFTQRTLPKRTILVEDRALVAELAPNERGIFQSAAVVQTRQVLDALRANIFPAVKIADQEFLERIEKQYTFSFDVDALAEPFPAPTLFLMGRQDSLGGYRDAWAILENYPRATYAVLDRAGHALGVEQVTLFRALVDEWLNRVEEYKEAASV